MFYNAQYNQYVNEGTAFVLGGTQYPANWLNCSTPEEKAQAGLVEVVTLNQPANSTYYWVTEQLNGAELSYINTPKDLTDVKATAIDQTNSTAYSLLFPTDWMVVKATETSTKVPTAWNSWRQSVRDVAANVTSMIEGAPDVDNVAGIMANINWPKNPDQLVAEGVAA
jgi:hypothetical protein